MILKRRVALNGIWLDELDERIIVSGIEPADGKENISATDAATGYGQTVTGIRRSTLDMVVKFKLWQKPKAADGLMERSHLLEMVNAWAAGGGILTVNYKPNRRLNVILAQAPGEESLWEFDKEFTITFRAYTTPFWEDEEENSAEIGGIQSEGSGGFEIGGSAETQCNVIMENMSGAQIKGLAVSAGGKKMKFPQTVLADGEALIFDHKQGRVRIRVRSSEGEYRNIMAERDPSSADDLMLKPGVHEAEFSAQRACKVTVTWRNRYL